MSKKRNRQPDANGDASEGSTESCEEASAAGTKCQHIGKAINLNKVKKNLKKTGIATECPACKTNEAKYKESEENEISNGPLWICLQCGNLGCGRNQRQHAIEHCQKPHSDSHCMVVSMHGWNVWCYSCETDIKADSRKKLLETVEFIKKSTLTSQPPPAPIMPPMPCQKESVNSIKDKQKSPNNFPRVSGLANLGNTCFFNAVLQCLVQTPYLVKVLEDLNAPDQKFSLPGGKHKVGKGEEEIELPPIEGTLDKWGNFTSILHKTLTEMQSSNGHQTYRPTELLSAFKKKNTQCMDGGQHDSHELLRHLLEIVRNEDLKRYQFVILKEIGLYGKAGCPNTIDDNMKSKVKFYGNQASARLLGPEPVFRGVLVSTLECLDCHHSSQRTEPFLDLSLPVMADKPQPPILKRKNSGLEDTFDMMGNNVSHVPWKNQLKKEKKAARKNRKNKKHNNHTGDDASPNQNNTTEENNGSVLESEESDADVEDNIEVEGPSAEVGESGYSSEKASAVASPVSPIEYHAANQNTYDLPNANLLHSPTELNSNSAYIDELNKSELNDLLELMKTSRRSDGVESSGSPENEYGVQSTFSPSTSLAANFDLNSPEAPTASALSTSVTSKDSPTSPLLSIIDGEVPALEGSDSPTPKIDLNQTVVRKDNEDLDLWSLEAQNDCRKMMLKGTVENGDITQKAECQAKVSAEHESHNDVHEVTDGMSRLGLSGNAHHSPPRYLTKEGECSIQSCLNQFTALELMSGSNKVGCEACTARENKGKENSNSKMVCTPSTKQYLVSKVPAVLILHLKRFQAQRVSFRKVAKTVTFPMVLDLSPVCKGHKKPRCYALYGVVEHSGTLHGGHYVAYVKSRTPLTPDDPRWSFLPGKDEKEADDASSDLSSDSEDDEASAKSLSTVEPPPGAWYFVSDSRVTEVDEATVLKSQAYLLFYERIL